MMRSPRLQRWLRIAAVIFWLFSSAAWWFDWGTDWRFALSTATLGCLTWAAFSGWQERAEKPPDPPEKVLKWYPSWW
ncbi:MAG TPA: hypothetical protein VFX60_12935 [Micromonospora sp.]|nr:hypothetical protein [Micromonospora sp.]